MVRTQLEAVYLRQSRQPTAHSAGRGAAYSAALRARLGRIRFYRSQCEKWNGSTFGQAVQGGFGFAGEAGRWRTFGEVLQQLLCCGRANLLQRV